MAVDSSGKRAACAGHRCSPPVPQPAGGLVGDYSDWMPVLARDASKVRGPDAIQPRYLSVACGGSVERPTACPRGTRRSGRGELKPVLRAESISKSFGHLRVLTSARLSVAPAAITLLTGRNGSGKSTLLRICAGRLAPDQGTIWLDDRIWTRARLHELARLGLFYIPDRDILSPVRSVRFHLDAIRERFGTERSIAEVAQLLKIGECLDRESHEISGGERRRSEIALALIRAPRCLLADEPLRGIDPNDRRVILGALRELADSGCAVLISGHETTDLLEVAGAVTWVTSGTTYELGPGSAAMRNERFRREYLTGAWL